MRTRERERAAVGAEPEPFGAAAQNAATSMDAATRRVQRGALEVKAELVAALLDGLAARRDAAVANRLAGASTEKASAYRAENAAASHPAAAALPVPLPPPLSPTLSTRPCGKRSAWVADFCSDHDKYHNRVNGKRSWRSLDCLRLLARVVLR